MPLTYRQVKDLYDSINPQEDLPEWSARQNALTGTDLYTAGLDDNILKRLSVGIDRAIESTPIDDWLGDAGATVGRWVGNEAAGRQIGQGTLRSLVDFAPMFIPGLGVAGKLATGLLAGGKSYTDTGSAASGVIGGLSSMLMPTVAGAAENLALRQFGVKPLVGRITTPAGKVEAFKRYLPQNLTQGLVAQGAGQAVGAGFSEVGRMAEAGFDPNREYEFSPSQALLEMTVGQLPFTALYATKGGKVALGGKATKDFEAQTKANMAATELAQLHRDGEESMRQGTPLSNIPAEFQKDASPVTHARVNNLLNELFVKQRKNVTDGTVIADPTNELAATDSIQQMLNSVKDYDGKGQMGVKLAKDTTREPMVGKEVFHRPGTGYRIIELEDGRRVGYSTRFEPESRDLGNGLKEFQVPLGFSSEVINNPEFANRRKAERAARIADPKQPELPVYEDEGSDHLDWVSEIAAATKLAEVAKTPGEMKAAIDRINLVRGWHGFKPMDDNLINQVSKKYNITYGKAIEAEARETERALQRREDALAKYKAMEGELADDDTSLGAMQGQGEEVFRVVDSLAETSDTDSGIPYEVDSILDQIAHKAEPDFNLWNNGAREKSSLGLELERFKIYSKLKRRGAISEGKLTPEDAEILNEAFAREGIDTKSPQDLLDYADRRYVQEFDTRMRQEVAKQIRGAGAPLPSADSETSPHAPKAYVPSDPAEIEAVKQLSPEKGSEGVLDYLLRTTENPEIRGLAEHFSQFREPLQRYSLVLEEPGATPRVHPSYATRGGTMYLPADILALPSGVREFYMVHELGHALTIQRTVNKADPVVQEIESLRQEVIKALPKDIRAGYEKAVASDFYKRYLDASAPITELHGDWDKANIIYSLLTTDEFVSQSWSSPAFKKLLSEMKSSTKVSFMSKLATLFKKLLGLDPKQPSMLDDVLRLNDRLAGDEHALTSFYNFTQRYFMKQGFSKEAAYSRAMLTTALARTYDGTQSLDVPSLFANIDHYGTAHSQDYTRARSELNQMLRKGGEDAEGFRELLTEAGYEPSQFGLDEFALSALNGDPVTRDMMELLPNTASRYVFEKLNDMRGMVDALRAVSTEKNKGLVQGGGRKDLQAASRESLKQIDRVLDHEKMLDQAVAAIQGLNGIRPDGFLEKLGALGENASAAAPFFGSAAPKYAPGAEPPGGMKRFSDWLGRTLKPIQQYDDPVFLEAATKGYQLQPNARKMQSEAMKIYGYDINTGKLTHEAIKRTTKLMKDPKLRKAYNSWIFENQKNGKQTGSTTRIPDTDPRVARHLKGLSPQELETVKEFVTKHEMVNKVMSSEILEKVGQIAVTDGAKILGHYNDLKVRDNIVLSREMQDILATDMRTPQAQMIMQNRLSVLQSKMSIEAFENLLKFHQTAQESYNTYKDFFGKNPAWSTAQRFGEYLVKFRKNGKIVELGVDSKKEAEELAEGSPILEFRPRIKGSQDEAAPHWGTDFQDVFNRLSELEENQFNIMKQFLPQNELDTLRKTSLVTQLARETAAQGFDVKQAPERGLTRGAEELPWLSNQISWLSKMSNYWSRQLFRHEIDTYINHKEIAGNEKLQNDLRTHKENMLFNDPESVRQLNNFVRTWYMGANAATAMTNATQPFVTHVAELTNLTGKMFDGYRRVKDAFKEVSGHKWGGRQWSTPEIEKMMNRAVDEGEVGLTQYDDDAAVQEAAATQFKTAADSGKPLTVAQKLGKAWGQFSNASMWLFSQGEQINNRVALISAFKLFRERGMSFDDAYNAAVQYNRRVNFTGGKASRPIGLFSGRSPVLRGAAMAASAMQSYVLGTTFQLARYIKRANPFGKSGLTPGEKFAAGKAAVQMLATQLAAAGVVGLPFVSAALGLLDKEFPQLEVNKNLREWVAGVFNDDDENGQLMTDVAMTGLPSMLGWDMQSRLSMGNTLPGVSEINGFQPEALLGPAVNLFRNFIEGGKKVVSGEGQRGLEQMLPSSAKKIIQLAGDDWKLKDYRDRPIFDPTPGEMAGSLLGYNPKRLSDFNAAQRMAKLSETNASREKGQMTHQLAEEVLAGNLGNVRQKLRSLMQADTSFDPADAIRSIAREAEELQFPRDLRREGSAPARSRLLGSFNLDMSQPQELLRLQFRQRIEREFGLSGSSNRETRLAILMDQLRAQAPEATRMELRRAAERIISGEKRPLLL